MTRIAIDAPTALRIVTEGILIPSAHALVGPTILRSHALSTIYRDARDGRIDAAMARTRLDGIATLKIRLLGDRVSRARTFALAEQLGWDDTPLAEYLAVASLQADVLATEDPVLLAGAEGIVPAGSLDEFLD